MQPKNERKPYALMLIALTVLLSACGTSLPTTSADCPNLPSRPSVATQTPPVSYSHSAASDIQRWQSRLTESIQTGRN